ncbi:MAG: 2,3-bisphosphoglycerate-independent phosphoglycerate mutase [Oscillospiraceae bacterium]|nr:2,3-bisphosphoglycerate-independent phosphoglycerate mutase [Oscillospiraceae bacterium]
MKTPAVMIILDGYALSDSDTGNAIAVADTPVLDKLFSDCPHTTLAASGVDVGLPDGQIGNSEVGHMNIGAGRIVYQDLPRISHEIESGDFYNNEALIGAVESAVTSGGALHLMGLVSSGGVHSHIEHLFGLIELARRHNVEKLFIHCFTDGRDVPPNSGKSSIEALLDKCRELGVGRVATVIGRFYAMDRDNRWRRVEAAYNAMVYGKGEFEPDPVCAMQLSYDAGITDEFVKPVICTRDGMIKAGDSVIFFNFRADRARQITRAFIERNFSGFNRKNGWFPVTFVSMTQYDETLDIPVAYPPDMPEHTLGEIISSAGLHQLRIAETEKYAHVTFFFNGGREEPFPGEERILVPSPAEFATYDLIPEMSAYKAADAACAEILSGKHDVVIINFANCDMVGHTGDFAATVKAVETVDTCVGKIKNAVDQVGGLLIVTSDHGNAETMLLDDGMSINTAHSMNPVPFIISGTYAALHPGRLADIAPTLLELLGLEQPETMTGQSLIMKGAE